MTARIRRRALQILNNPLVTIGPALLGLATFYLLLTILPTWPWIAMMSFILLASGGTAAILIYRMFHRELSRIEFLFYICILIIFTLVSYALLYSTAGAGENFMLEFGTPKHLTFADGLYFSLVTLATVGYGDIVPHGIYRLFAATEVILGFFYLGLLLSGISKIYEVDARPTKK